MVTSQWGCSLMGEPSCVDESVDVLGEGSSGRRGESEVGRGKEQVHLWLGGIAEMEIAERKVGDRRKVQRAESSEEYMAT